MHGGEALASLSSCKTTNKKTKNSINNNKQSFNNELNVFDKIVEQDVQNVDLVDDFSMPERAGEREQGNIKKMNKYQPKKDQLPLPLQM